MLQTTSRNFKMLMKLTSAVSNPNPGDPNCRRMIVEISAGVSKQGVKRKAIYKRRVVWEMSSIFRFIRVFSLARDGKPKIITLEIFQRKKGCRGEYQGPGQNWGPLERSSRHVGYSLPALESVPQDIQSRGSSVSISELKNVHPEVHNLRAETGKLQAKQDHEEDVLGRYSFVINEEGEDRGFIGTGT